MESPNVHLRAQTHRYLEQWVIEVGTSRDKMDGQSLGIYIYFIYMVDFSYLKAKLQILTWYSVLRQFSELEPIDWKEIQSSWKRTLQHLIKYMQ